MCGVLVNGDDFFEEDETVAKVWKAPFVEEFTKEDPDFDAAQTNYIDDDSLIFRYFDAEHNNTGEYIVGRKVLRTDLYDSKDDISVENLFEDVNDVTALCKKLGLSGEVKLYSVTCYS